MSRIFLVGVKELSVGRQEMRVGSPVVEGLAKGVVQLQESL